VRRRAFESVGGFDDRFRAPGVEDIDLGYRLKRAGYRLRLEKSLQGRHWKRWTVASMARCDVFDRGLPWTRLLLRYRRADNTLNLTRTDLWSAASACAFPVLLTASGWIPLLLLPAALAAVAFAALQRPFYRFLAESRGPGFLPRALLLHILHFQCAAAGFALGILAACLCGHAKPCGGAARCS
jgi:hypothetical protein